MRNMAELEQGIRIVIGLGLISLVFIGPQTPWGWIGAIMLVTGGISFCPLYKVIGFSTHKA